MTDPTIISTAREIKALLGYDPDSTEGNAHVGCGDADWGRAVTLDLATARRLLALAQKATDQPYLALDEVDAVEVFHALDKTAQAYCTFGDKITSAHFASLYGKLVNAPKGAG